MADGASSRFSRRRFLGTSAAVAGGIGASSILAACTGDRAAENVAATVPVALPFHGVHQNGIALARQRHLMFAAFDAIAPSRDKLVELLRTWTDVAAALSAGTYVSSSGEADGLGPARLTITFGFGPSLFAATKGDRFGIAAERPPGLIDLPAFRGDQLEAAMSGGDVGIQVCADDPTVVFHAVRALTRAGQGAAVPRWSQRGFVSVNNQEATPPESPRNLMGFRDGTSNLPFDDETALRDHLWVQATDGPPWLRDGTYLVTRRIRIDLDQWDRTSRAEQEAAVGRVKATGAPMSGGDREHDVVRFESERIASDAHIRLSAPDNNNGARMLRRSYSYVDDAGASARIAESGLFFVSYQRSIERQFVPIQARLADGDALNAFSTHTASAVFAVPPGVPTGGFVGESLFT